MRLFAIALIVLAASVCSVSCYITQSAAKIVYDGERPMAAPAALLQNDNDAMDVAPFEFVPLTHVMPNLAQPVVLSEQHHTHHLQRHHHHHAAGHGHRHRQKRHHRYRLRSSKAKHHHRWSWPWSEDKAIKYGPDSCVETYKSARGTCVIETKCSQVDISNTSLELLCVLEDGDKVQHVFDKGSFDAEEQFDTMISCRKCLAPLEAKSDPRFNGALGKIDAMHAEVQELTKTLEGISASVNTLSAAVFGGGPPAPAAASPAVAIAAAAIHTKAKVSFLDKAEALVEQLDRETETKAKHPNSSEKELDGDQDDIE